MEQLEFKHSQPLTIGVELELQLVNTSDFNLLAANFGQPGTGWFGSDFNYDGAVNTTDFNLLASRFGTTLPPAPAARFSVAAVPPHSEGPSLFGDRLIVRTNLDDIEAELLN